MLVGVVERARTTLRQETPSMEDFLDSLEMEAEVAVAGGETLGRVAQLVGRTNQFNLTTRRHSPADLARMAEADDTVVACLRLRDRFGDQGLIAVGILKQRGHEAYLDTFLMSCRVMNRGVERAMMAYLAERGADIGCSRLIGEYRPTAKNHMVERLFPDLGFTPHGRMDGGTVWELDLTPDSNMWPGHIRRVDAAGHESEEGTTT